jgi:hypothetical protein
MCGAFGWAEGGGTRSRCFNSGYRDPELLKVIEAVLLQICLRELTCCNLSQEAEYPSFIYLFIFAQNSNLFALKDDFSLSQLSISFIYSLPSSTLTLRTMKYRQHYYVHQKHLNRTVSDLHFNTKFLLFPQVQGPICQLLWHFLIS